MIDDDSNYLRAMREQYEAYPYPPRNPAHENNRLVLTETESLGKINHFCFNGRLDLSKGFRVLVAGGGTGDQTIFLAEQLRNFSGEVVYLDLSLASMQIAKNRAKIRKLNNITWVHGSILDVQKHDIGTFDYINCCGVLMVLEDPVAGLKALKTCLNKNGVMGIMVYAKYGRTGIYHMQELMRTLNTDETDIRSMLENARVAFSSLPETHSLKSGSVPLSNEHAAELDDSDWYDLFLITQDIAYTVPEIYDWQAKCDLKMICFATQRNFYNPETHLKNEKLLKKVKKMPLPVQQAVAENMVSTITRHRFYTGLLDATVATISDLNNIPYFCDVLPFTVEQTQQLQALIYKQPVGAAIDLYFQNENIKFSLSINKMTKVLIKYIDGFSTIGQIIKATRNDPDTKKLKVSTTEIKHQLRQLYDYFNEHNLLLLRHKSTTSFKTYSQLNIQAQIK